MSGRYWEDPAGSCGIRAPRAFADTDARTLRLDGTWRFRLSPTPEGTGAAFTQAGFDDSAWDPMPVPSHWVLEEFTPLAGGPRRSMRGTAEGPLYTNTAYPVPLDPPRVPDENPTGDYRLEFDAPEDWGASVLRFQGVDSCAKVWLNGVELGWAMGSRLPFEFEAPVRPGRNVLAVRVHRWSAGTYLEDQDMWWLPGIFREVEVIERPEAAIDDHFVHADYDPASGLGTLWVDATTPAVVEVPELGIRIAAGESATVSVAPWSAESPRLYRGTLRSEGETIRLAIGFRRVEIRDGVLLANGAPLTFRGVNRHEHHPETGRTLDVETMRRDIVLMKRANIDAVRTSHYPPHPEFLRLCDELGLWVVVECDLETHGFIYSGWEGNPPADPRWRDALLERLRRTVERDKNRPSVIVWSLANESDRGEAFGEMRRWLDERDPSRPVLYERDPSYRDSDFYSVMYPSLELLEQIGRGEEPAPEGITEAEDERRRRLPFLLIEYAHAMGNGPGSLQDYWHIMSSHPRICGGFVWEWIDHGFTARTDDGTEYVMHGEDVAYEPNGGRFSLHGLVFSDRTPTPGLVELAKAYEPIRIEVTGDDVVVRNDRHSADTSDLVFAWRMERDGEPAGGGRLQVPVLAPGQECALPLHVPPADDETGLVVVTVEAALAADASWAPAGHIVAWGQGVKAEPPVPEPVASPRPEGRATGRIRRGEAVFDADTGGLVSLGGLELAGPWLDLYRAPTENDRGQGELNDVAAVWRRTGLDRLVHRIDDVSAGEAAVRISGRTAPAAHPHGVAWTMHWSDTGDGAWELAVTADFVGPWADTPYMHRDVWVPRLGLLFALPTAYRDAEWLGRGPGETYVDSFAGSRIGRYRRAIDDLQVPYPVPQENGNHVDTRELLLTGDGVPPLRVQGLPVFDFTARRWRASDLERAAHPHELADTGTVWLNVDHRQMGVGSASVGPALPERYRVPRERTAWRVRLRVG